MKYIIISFKKLPNIAANADLQSSMKFLYFLFYLLLKWIFSKDKF